MPFQPRSHYGHAFGKRGLVDDTAGNKGMGQREQLTLRERNCRIHLIGQTVFAAAAGE